MSNDKCVMMNSLFHPNLLNRYGFDVASLGARMHIANHREGGTPRGSHPSSPSSLSITTFSPTFCCLCDTLICGARTIKPNNQNQCFKQSHSREQTPETIGGSGAKAAFSRGNSKLACSKLSKVAKNIFGFQKPTPNGPGAR